MLVFLRSKLIHSSFNSLKTRWSNHMMERTLRIVPYDHSWPVKFHEETDAIFGMLLTTTEVHIVHIGSTSVPGLAAKPVVDIMASRINNFTF